MSRSIFVLKCVRYKPPVFCINMDTHIYPQFYLHVCLNDSALTHMCKSVFSPINCPVTINMPHSICVTHMTSGQSPRKTWYVSLLFLINVLLMWPWSNVDVFIGYNGMSLWSNMGALSDRMEFVFLMSGQRIWNVNDWMNMSG